MLQKNLFIQYVPRMHRLKDVRAADPKIQNFKGEPFRRLCLHAEQREMQIYQREKRKTMHRKT
jgi:hypothetical protein